MGEALTATRPGITVTRTKLTVIALISLLFYTAGVCVVEHGLLCAGNYGSAELARMLAENSGLMLLSTWAVLFRLMGGLGVPVFAFLLVEVFEHSFNGKRELFTLGAMALLSEIPYDLAMSGKVWDPTAQNGLLTLTVSLVMLYGLRLWRGKPGIACRLAQAAVIVAAALWCDLLRTQFGLYLVGCTALFYVCYDRKGGRLLLMVGWTLVYVLVGLLSGDGAALGLLSGVLAVYALWCYEGEGGWKGSQALAVGVYPLQLLLLWGMASLLVH